MADATLQHNAAAGHGLAGEFEAPLFGAYSKKVGMWLFLASDSLTFGALLFAFSYNRIYTVWPTPFGKDSIINATVMTACLLSSSLTMVMAVFAAALSGDAHNMDALKQLPAAIETTLRLSSQIAQPVERYRYMDRCIVIGRGYNYATSFELALKLKELTYIMASAYSSADFRHGPIATIDSGLPVFLLMPTGATYDDMLDLARELQHRGAELLVISESEQALSLARTALPIYPGVPEWLTPLITIIPGQLFVLNLALTKGLNPDIPRGLHKVTRTL